MKLFVSLLSKNIVIEEKELQSINKGEIVRIYPYPDNIDIKGEPSLCRLITTDFVKKYNKYIDYGGWITFSEIPVDFIKENLLDMFKNNVPRFDSYMSNQFNVTEKDFLEIRKALKNITKINEGDITRSILKYRRISEELLLEIGSGYKYDIVNQALSTTRFDINKIIDLGGTEFVIEHASSFARTQDLFSIKNKKLRDRLKSYGRVWENNHYNKIRKDKNYRERLKEKFKDGVIISFFNKSIFNAKNNSVVTHLYDNDRDFILGGCREREKITSHVTVDASHAYYYFQYTGDIIEDLHSSNTLIVNKDNLEEINIWRKI